MATWATIAKTWIGTIPEKLRNFPAWARKKRRELAREALPIFLAELQERQPVGEDDPFVAAFPMVRRSRRPSVRQGLIPIELGWHGSVVETNRGARIEITSDSEHLQYFTTWTGRRHLGTRKRDPQVARNAKTLAFWWQGEGHWPNAAQGGGFVPDTDFVQDAYNETKKYWERSTPLEARKARLYILE